MCSRLVDSRVKQLHLHVVLICANLVMRALKLLLEGFILVRLRPLFLWRCHHTAASILCRR